MRSFFYIKKIGEHRYYMGVATSKRQARNYHRFGRLVLFYRAADIDTAVRWLAWARFKLQAAKQGEEYRIKSPDRIYEIKRVLDREQLTIRRIILYQVELGVWKFERMILWGLWVLFRQDQAVEAWHKHNPKPYPWGHPKRKKYGHLPKR